MDKTSIPLPSEAFFDSINAVVLDLDGVIVDLDFNLTFNSFFPHVSDPKIIHELRLGHWPTQVYQYERGEISTITFRQQLQQTLNIATEDFFHLLARH